MYPVCLNIRNQLCVVIGGGTVAERKVAGLVEACAKVKLISPGLTPALRMLADDNCIDWQQKHYTTGDLAGAMLVFAATDKRDVQEAVFSEAQKNGQLVNVIDEPEKCAFQVPAVVRRGDLVLAVATSGKSPAVAAWIRRQLENSYGPEYEYLINIMAELRHQVLTSDLGPLDRKMVFKNILHKDIIQWIREEKWDHLRKHLRKVLGKEVDFDISQPGRDI